MSEETQNVSTEQEIKNDVQKELKTDTEVNTDVEETTEAPAVEEVDYEAENKILQEKIAKVEAERDNYRKMGLKYKKGDQEEVVPELSDEDKIRAIFKEEYANSEIAKIQKEKDDLLSKLLRENKELKIATQNNTKANISSAGSGKEGRDVNTDDISPEKIKELHKIADSMNLQRDSFVKRYKENRRNNTIN